MYQYHIHFSVRVVRYFSLSNRSSDGSKAFVNYLVGLEEKASLSISAAVTNGLGKRLLFYLNCDKLLICMTHYVGFGNNYDLLFTYPIHEQL